MAEQGYVLHSELRGHQEDVRAVIGIDDLGLATGSRDKTIKLWRKEGGQYISDDTLVEHTDFVTALASVPPGTFSNLSTATVLSGSRDTSVILWNTSTAAPAVTLTGHKYQVTSLAIGRRGEVISASLDGTIRVHSGADFKDVAVLDEHTGPVQALLVLPDSSLLSGSNDGTIKRWVDNKCQQTFTGHTDTVRGLALLPGVGIVSASHDFTLRVWDMEGRLVSELLGHTAIVYSAAASASGLIASASEDNTARVWRADGTCLQTLPHAKCVWDIAFLPNNDLVTACADYVARIWTTDQSRQAPVEVLEAYQAALTPPSAEQHDDMDASSSLPAGMKMEDEVALLQPGTKDGQIKIIREGGGGMAYSWSQNLGQWEKVGQVVGGPGSGDDTVGVSGKSIDGVTYDHVISVEVDDRGPPLKLGVNRGDNPYDVADRFIEKHDLPASYREQIVQFVIQNTDGSSDAGQPATVNVDPFTGGAAYVPGSASYGRPGQAQQPASNNSDPFTGGGAYVPGSSRSNVAATHIPATTMLIFDNLLNVSIVAAKVRQLSEQLAGAVDTLSMALTDAEAAPGGILDSLLASASATPTAGLTEESTKLLGKLLRWPAAALFPVLDVTRLVILHEPTAETLASSAGDLQLSPLGTLGAALATSLAEPQLPSNQQTSLRLLCNAFHSDSLRAWLAAHAGELLDAVAPALSAPQKAVRGAAAAFLLDLSVLSSSRALGGDVQAQALSAIVTLLSATPQEDVEALYRAVVALGTFVEGPGGQEAKEVTRDLDCLSLLVQLGRSGSNNVASAATQVVHLIGS